MMKKRIFLVLLMLMLLAVGCAQAELQLPLDGEGEPVWLRCTVPWQEGVASYAPLEDAIYIAGADDVYRRCGAVIDDAPVREALDAMEKRMDAAGIESSSLRMHSPNLITDGETMLGISSSGVLFSVEFRGKEASLTALAVLDTLPQKPQKGFCTVIGAGMDRSSVYLLVQSSNPEQDNITSALYAYDRSTWQRREVPLAMPEGSYAGSIDIYKEGMALINAVRRSDYASGGLLVMDLSTGDSWPLTEETGVLTLPDNPSVLACDGQRETVILGQRDLIYAISPQQGLKAIGRLSDYGVHAVIHPDGRVLVISDELLLTLDAQKELTIQTLSVLTDGIYAPDDAYNTEIPDIRIATTEVRELTGQQSAADQFASDMTTQSGRWDMFVLPISEAAQIAQKGYYVPITGDQAEVFLKDLHPFAREQVTNAAGELVMAPLSVYRRDTIAYDPRAAALLGIDAAELPTTYAEMFDFLRRWEEDYGGLAVEHDISLFETSSARAVGTLRERLFQDVIALSRSDRDELRALAEELGALLDATLPLGRSVSDPVVPYFGVPTIMSASSDEPPAHLEEPAFLFTLGMSSLPSSQVEWMPYKYLMYMEPFDLALTADTKPLGVFYGYALVINPYSAHQEAVARYVDYALRHLSDRAQADLLRSAKPVESMYMLCYTQDAGTIAAITAKMDAYPPEEQEHRKETLAFLRARQEAMEPFLYEITPEQIARYQGALEHTRAVWMEVADAVEPCQAVWEQFLRGGASGRQVVQRVLDVSEMMMME